MKKSKSLLFSAPLVAATLCIGIVPTFGQTTKTPADPSTSTSAANKYGTTGTTSSTVGKTTATADTITASTGAGYTSGKLKFSDKHFVNKVAEGGQLELAMADLAAQKASSPEVRNFAQQLSTDHAAMAAKLTELAAAKGLSSDIAEYSYREGSVALTSGSTPSGSIVTPGASADGTPVFNRNLTNTGANGGVASTNSADERSRINSGTNGANTGTVGSTSTAPNRNMITTDSTLAANNRSVSTGSDATREIAGNDAASASARVRANNDSTLAGAPTGQVSETANSDWNDPTKNRHYKSLAKKTGTDFDQAYITAMISDHEDDVSAFEKKSKNADDADVKAFATENLPKLREHLEKAKSLSARVMSP